LSVIDRCLTRDNNPEIIINEELVVFLS